jgi:hypothetical protein
MFSTERDIFLAKEEFIPSEEIGEPINVLNSTAVIITLVLCLLLFRIL